METLTLTLTRLTRLTRLTLTTKMASKMMMEMAMIRLEVLRILAGPQKELIECQMILFNKNNVSKCVFKKNSR